MKVTSITAACFAWQSLTSATELLTPEKIEAGVRQVDLERNLWNLNQIAKKNGGNRAFGLPGYKASSDYVLERVQTRFGDQFDTSLQYFNHTFEQTNDISVTGPDGEDVAVITLLYNNATPLPGGVTAPLIDTPVDDVLGSACTAAQWEGINPTGKLVLIKRGTCAISEKLKLAKNFGALGVILYHNLEGTPNSATLSAENIGLIAPVGVIAKSVGEAWKARLAAGEALTVTLLVDSVFETRESWNIFSETKEGDPHNVVMLGAHLDSVQAGPGINDDGSGTSGILEILSAFRHYKGFKNKVRFAWWGAEESGLIGSLYYTSHLTEQEADKIRFYFNYDMIGSPFPVWAVYKGDNAGDAPGAQILLDYLVAKGKPAYYGSFGTGSDYVGFLQLGIPSSGLFSGAGAPTDPCYHLACDTTSNINAEALTLNSKAAGWAAAKFALSLDGVPPRKKTTVNRRNKMELRAEFQKWEKAAHEAADTHTCSHKNNNVV
ncbi:related to aminopeptidase Y precursor, vacuolar [Rhynchosporium agropyri]|uniref:Peptide hydrolase n=1 Tax=Rhynchosporium agropyri TaxID=914238 RepID=A0A1E1KY88_9HELO|nr:related to aminopeptidase Y precursor, vacuolar [Rhynchosporium agropyri]